MGPSCWDPVEQGTPCAEAGEETVSVRSVHGARASHGSVGNTNPAINHSSVEMSFGCRLAGTIVVRIDSWVSDEVR